MSHHPAVIVILSLTVVSSFDGLAVRADEGRDWVCVPSLGKDGDELSRHAPSHPSLFLSLSPVLPLLRAYSTPFSGPPSTSALLLASPVSTLHPAVSLDLCLERRF